MLKHQYLETRLSLQLAVHFLSLGMILLDYRGFFGTTRIITVLFFMLEEQMATHRLFRLM